MILIPILALVVGLLLGLSISKAGIDPTLAPYLSVAVLAGLDSICGGSRSHMEGKFQTDIFVTGFLFNILIAVFFVWLGLGIGINLMLAAGVVFGMRIFTNLSLIRRLMVTRYTDARKRKQLESELASRTEGEVATGS